jgi:hypothetical protein
MTFRKRLQIGFGLAAFVACRVNPIGPDPTVSFMIDAPLCSSTIPVQFSIDSVLVGTDTFIVHYGPEHLMSHAFSTSAGQHTLSARGTFNGYTWPEKKVTLVQGQAFTDTLPFYCS